MAVRSAGLLIYRYLDQRLQVLLVHPGGPFWARKEEAAWSIPKGLVEAGEDDLAAARREAMEELGVEIEGPFERLGEYKQPSGKVLIVWMTKAAGAFETKVEMSSTFELEWPSHSGKMTTFPEVDRAEWFSIGEAAIKLHKGQRPMLRDLMRIMQVENGQ